MMTTTAEIAMFEAVVIPVQGPIERIKIAERESLERLQAAVGGDIEAIPFPDEPSLTCYINEEGKYTCLDEDGEVEINRRATALVGPGLFAGDFIAGPLVVCGFDPATGTNKNAPGGFEQRIEAPVLRLLPEPEVIDKRGGGRSINYEFTIEQFTNESGEPSRKIAVLVCGFRKAGANFFSGKFHGTEYYAGVRNETVSKGKYGITHSFNLGGSSGPLIMREEATRYSQKKLGEFAELALVRLRAAYAQSNPAVTKMFATSNGGAL